MKIYFQENSIKYETLKATLVKVPKRNLKVWIPSRFIRRVNWYYEAYLPDSMAFHLINKVGKYAVSAQTLKDIFDGEGRPGFKVEEHTPREVKPKRVEADDSLKR